MCRGEVGKMKKFHKYCTDTIQETRRKESTKILFLVTIPLTAILNEVVIPCICTRVNENACLKGILDLLVDYNVLTLSVSYVGIFTLLYFLVNRWLWHILYSFFAMSDIRGVWTGKLISSYGPTEVNVTLDIRQRLHEICIEGYFINQNNKESRSYSTMACLIPTGGEITHLSYVYKNESEVGEKYHDGLCQITITRTNDGKEEIKGDYFTNRKVNGTPPYTYGKMDLEKCTNKDAKEFRKAHKHDPKPLARFLQIVTRHS